ncbi:response regulator [Polyangium fumosum]|uniref:Response regulator n=1 Tax=Polyangium fumosum TaxID=889272 RepID=A0A4U1J9U4_9BACT|nr:response regulator [Polyangium fumosum]TKD03826.1 response regulator [Polyangium fumosum]
MSAFALVAETDPILSAAQVAVVDALGLVPLVAQDGERAIWLLRRFGTPALLITSLSLPVVDGFEVLDWLRARISGRSAKVIVTSPFPELRAFAGALREHLGISAILPRNASPDTLRSLAEALLKGAELPAPLSEAARSTPVHSVRSMQEGPRDPRLDWFVRSAAEELHASVALAMVAQGEGRALISAVGMDARRWPVLGGIGRHVLGAGETLVVSDAFAHPFFQGDVSVMEGLVRGFAAAPVLDAAGRTRGMLCVIEPKARLRIGPEGLVRLAERARLIGTAIPNIEPGVGRLLRASRRRIIEAMPDSAPISSPR